MKEAIEFAVRSAIRFEDATTQLAIVGGLRVEGKGFKPYVSRGGVWIVEATEPEPDAEEATFEVRDPSGRFFPQRFPVRVRLRPDDEQPVLKDISLFRTPEAPLGAGWAVVRVRVQEEREQGEPKALPGVLVRLVRVDDGTLLARGLTEWRPGREEVWGDAMLATQALPLLAPAGAADAPDVGDADPPADGDVDLPADAEAHPEVQSFRVRVEAFRDPQLKLGAKTLKKTEKWPDVNELEARRGDLPSKVTELVLGAGGQEIALVEFLQPEPDPPPDPDPDPD